jgi:hypothetical protein
MTLEVILHSLVEFKARHDAMNLRKGKNIFNQNQFDNEYVEDLVHQDA